MTPHVLYVGDVVQITGPVVNVDTGKVIEMGRPLYGKVCALDCTGPWSVLLQLTPGEGKPDRKVQVKTHYRFCKRVGTDGSGPAPFGGPASVAG